MKLFLGRGHQGVSDARPLYSAVHFTITFSSFSASVHCLLAGCLQDAHCAFSVRVIIT